MKSIGIFGGVGWAATIPAYELLNREINSRMGGSHSARIILYSVDYGPFKDLYHHGWDRIPPLFREEMSELVSMRPDCILLACNTLHKAFDSVEAQLGISVPFFHAVRLTRDFLLNSKVKKALFLGTVFTMEDDYFMGPLRQVGIELVLPTVDEKQAIQEAQAQLAKGEKNQHITAYFQRLLAHYETQGCSNVILACTELPLAINDNITRMTIVDPLVLQCRAAVNYVLG